MVSAVQLVVFYLIAWLVVTAVLSRRFNEERGSRIVVTPLAVAFKSSFTFESFSRLRGNRLLAAFLDAGIVDLVVMMVAAYYVLTANIVRMFATGQRVGVVVPIIPGVTIGPEAFLYLLPGLVVAVLLHEAFHAIAARFEGISVKSSGLMLFLGLIPAAFVEPDEEELAQAPRRAKLRIYSAGVLANTILFLLFTSVLAALGHGGYYIVVSTVPNSPAAAAGLPEKIIVKEIHVNGTVFKDLESFVNYMVELRETHGGSIKGVTLVVEFVSINGNVYKVVKPEEADAIGIYLSPLPKSLASLGPAAAQALYTVLYYAQAINIGLAGINAVPIFITDGAQFIAAAVEPRLGSVKARMLSNIVSAATLVLLLPNIAI